MMPHEIKLETQAVLSYYNGYRCSCGVGIAARSLSDAKRIHSHHLEIKKMQSEPAVSSKPA